MLTLLAQVTPPTPTVPGSGDFWNPANWAPFVTSTGIPGFFAVVFLIVMLIEGWLLLKRRGSLTNDEQTRRMTAYLRELYKASNTRHQQLAAYLDNWLNIVGVFARKADVDITARLEEAHRTLRLPPPVPETLFLANDDANNNSGNNHAS